MYNGTATSRVRRLYQQGQTDAAQQLQPGGQTALIADGTTFALNKLTQEIRQHGEEGMPAHLLVRPMILRAHGQGVHILALPERRLGLLCPCEATMMSSVDQAC